MKLILMNGNKAFYNLKKKLRNSIISIKSVTNHDILYFYFTNLVKLMPKSISQTYFKQVILIATLKKQITPINEKIRASEVMLIGANGEKHGVITFAEAIELARAASLDLVQVSPSDASPLVCKLLDYGKYVFDKKKSLSSSKVKVKRNTTKEIKFRPSTDVGDYNIKLKKVKSFILDGDKTKISVRFRGREILNSEMGLSLLNRLRDELEDIAQVDQEPSLEGRQLLMVLSPLKKK